MKGVFDLDGFLMRLLTKVYECICISALWLLFSLPIVTIGASTGALFHTTNRTFLHERGRIWNEFWGCFKSNFKNTTIMWLIVLLGMILSVVDFTAMLVFFPDVSTINIIVFVYLMWFLTTWGLYAISYTISIHEDLKMIFKNSFRMMLANIFRSMLLFAGTAAFLISMLLFPALVVFIPVLYACFIVYLMGKIFAKYVPQEELEAKEETYHGVNG